MLIFLNVNSRFHVGWDQILNNFFGGFILGYDDSYKFGKKDYLFSFIL